MDFSDVTVVIPTLNEGENILKLIKKIEDSYPKIFVTVVDDGSKDRTQKIVNEFHKKNPKIILLDRSKEKVHGLTVSILHGIKLIKTKYFIAIDGDLEHPSEKIKDIIKKLKEGNNNKLVIGVREKVAIKWPFHRKLMSKVASFLGNFVLSIKKSPRCSDILSGFFGGDTEFVKNLIKINENEKKFELQGYKILFDILKILPKETKIAEVPYIFGFRKFGKSKIKLMHILAFLKSLFK